MTNHIYYKRSSATRHEQAVLRKNDRMTRGKRRWVRFATLGRGPEVANFQLFKQLNWDMVNNNDPIHTSVGWIAVSLHCHGKRPGHWGEGARFASHQLVGSRILRELGDRVGHLSCYVCYIICLWPQGRRCGSKLGALGARGPIVGGRSCSRVHCQQDACRSNSMENFY